jgi:hypothetical protein
MYWKAHVLESKQQTANGKRQYSTLDSILLIDTTRQSHLAAQIPKYGPIETSLFLAQLRKGDRIIQIKDEIRQRLGNAGIRI